MTEPAQDSPRPVRRSGIHRPVWIGWSMAAVAVAVASVVVATGVSDRGAGVRLPPAINIGTGITSQPSPPPPSGRDTTTDPPSVEVPPDTTQVQTLPQPGSNVSSPGTKSSSTDHSASDGQAEPGDPPTTVAPDYPVVTGGSTDSPPTGGSDS